MIKFFKTIISKFLDKDTYCEELFRIAGEIFNWERNLHSKVLHTYLNSKVNEFDKRHSFKQMRVMKEQKWREDTLKVGDKVDVIKSCLITQINGSQLIQSWSKGVVVFKGIPEDAESNEVGKEHVADFPSVEIRYEMDIEAEVKRFKIFDPDFAYPGTFTDDYDWRFDLKVDDLIDCIDDEKQWLKSTVLQTRITNNADGEPIPEVLVGYRTFDENGPRPDEDRGMNFFGWSKKYDVWIAVTSP